MPELQPVEGLAVPASPSVLRLPVHLTTAVPFGTKNAEGDGVCLDKPLETTPPRRPPVGPEAQVE